MSGTRGLPWSSGKASGGDFVKDKWPGPASSAEPAGNPGCSAMNQRVPSGGVACLPRSCCHRSKACRHQASARRQPKQQSRFVGSKFNPGNASGQGGPLGVQGSRAALPHSALGGRWEDPECLTPTQTSDQRDVGSPRTPLPRCTPGPSESVNF